MGTHSTRTTMLSVYSPAFTSPFSRPFSGFGSFDREDLDDFFGPFLLQPQVDRARHKRPRGREVEPRGSSGVLSLFGGFMKHGDHSDVSNMHLDLDVVEQEGNYQVKADLPGVKKEDIKVSLNEESNVLTLSATKSDEVNHDTDAYKRRERRFEEGAARMSTAPKLGFDIMSPDGRTPKMRRTSGTKERRIAARMTAGKARLTRKAIASVPVGMLLSSTSNCRVTSPSALGVVDDVGTPM